MANIVINLWGRDLIQQRETQMSILITCKGGDFPNKEIKRCYQRQLQTVQAAHKQNRTEADSSTLYGGATAGRPPAALPLT